jgi:hypothetical protein
MKRVAASFVLFLLFSHCNAQTLSDLHARVDSLIRYELKFEKEAVQVPVRSGRSTIRGSQTSPQSNQAGEAVANTLLIDNEPLIVFNGIVVNKNNLNSFTLKDIRKISVLQPGSQTLAAYGSRSVNGVIVIEGVGKNVSDRLKALQNGL